MVEKDIEMGQIQSNRKVKTLKLPQMLKEVEVIYISPVRARKIKIVSSVDAYDLLCDLFDGRKIDLKEMFYIILLNRANYCIGYSMIGVGNTTSVVVNKIEIFQLAILTNAANIILAHNHPSGNLKASEADRLLTLSIAEGCKLFDITLLDHLIISSDGYLSLAEEGLI